MRVRHFFTRYTEARTYYDRIRAEHPHSDVICVKNLNAEDKARGYPQPRINGWDVIHNKIPETEK